MGKLAKLFVFVCVILVSNITCISRKNVPIGYKKFKANKGVEYLFPVNWQYISYSDGVDDLYPSYYDKRAKGFLFTDNRSDSLKVNISLHQVKSYKPDFYAERLQSLKSDSEIASIEERKLVSGEKAIFYTFTQKSKDNYLNGVCLSVYHKNVITYCTIYPELSKYSISELEEKFKLIEFSNLIFSYLKVR